MSGGPAGYARTHSVEAEQSLLGGLMLSPKAWSRVARIVAAPDLYRADHRLIFGAVVVLAERGIDGDPVTVAEHLQRAGQLEAAGGVEYLARLVDDTPSAANVESYARIVHELAVKRRLKEAAAEIARRVDTASDLPATELVADAAKLVHSLQQTARTGRGLVSSPVLVGELLDDLDRRRAGQRGLSIGLADFDRISYGLEPGDLIVVAGRPGMGKTALLTTIAANVSATAGVAVFSAEMPAEQLMRRAVALFGKVSQSRLRRADELVDADWTAIERATSALAARRLWIDDTPSPALTHIRAEVLAHASRGALGLVAVDYVQLVRGAGRNRYEELRDVAYGLKALAKEAHVPIVLLAQLNREVESRDVRRPRLSDLRDSGAIEEAADIVGLLYSEGYYDPDFPIRDVLECAIAKNRNGERGDCLWRFDGALSHVTVLADDDRSGYLRVRAQRSSRGASGDL